MVEVLVVGAGIAGLRLGSNLERKADGRVLVIEEDKYLGKCCAGLVGKEIYHSKLEENGVINKIKGSIVRSPSGSEVEIRSKKEVAYVISREEVLKSLSRGLDLSMGERLIGLDLRKKEAITSKERRIEFDVIIGASGGKCAVSRALGVMKNEKPILYCLQCEVESISLDKDLVEIYLNEKISPGFISYLVPTGAERARIGVCSNNPVSKNNLEKFLDEVVRKHHGSFQLKRIEGGFIRLKGPETTEGVNFLLVGEEGGQVKPTTGGGINYSLICSDIASQFIERFLDGGKLIGYHSAWKKVLGREIRFGLMVRRMMDFLGNREYELMVKILSEFSPSLDDFRFDSHLYSTMRTISNGRISGILRGFAFWLRDLLTG